MYLKVQYSYSDLDSWDSVDAKNGLTHLDWTPDTRDTKCVLKWVLVRIAALCCATRPQIWIPQTEYYQKVSSHAQIWPQGAEKQLRKVNVVGGGWVYRSKTRTAPAPSRAEQSRALERSLSIRDSLPKQTIWQLISSIIIYYQLEGRV